MRNKQKNGKTVWHYTYNKNLSAILQSKVLLPPYLTPGFAKQEAEAVAEFGEAVLKDKGFVADKKLLLFSQREDWEPASFRAFAPKDGGLIIDVHRLEEYASYGCDVFRIGVLQAILHRWTKLKWLSGMPKWMASALEKTARETGSNPYDWWGTMKPVGIDQWNAIQVWNPESKAWETFAEIKVERVEIPVEVSATKTDVKV